MHVYRLSCKCCFAINKPEIAACCRTAYSILLMVACAGGSYVAWQLLLLDARFRKHERHCTTIVAEDGYLYLLEQ